MAGIVWKWMEMDRNECKWLEISGMAKTGRKLHDDDDDGDDDNYEEDHD